LRWNGKRKEEENDLAIAPRAFGDRKQALNKPPSFWYL
jgi:hypothetical protein